MRHPVVGFACALAAVAVLAPPSSHGDTRARSALERRMSFHNRLLLNRVVLAGLKSMEVLLLAADTGGASTAGVSAAVVRLDGRVLRAEPEIGYLRIEIAPERLLELSGSAHVAAYQIASFSRGTWYRDGPPLSNALLQRSFEVTPVAAAEPRSRRSGLPPLTPAESRAAGFTADEDVGVGAWIKTHPTFDGRGVTIALVEDGLPSFADPVFRTAKSLNGRDLPKIAGILNAIDPAQFDETRVRLTTLVESTRSWARIGNRTLILPRPGTYRVGLFEAPAGNNVIHRFAVAEHADTREIWLDTNGDASLQDETPLADVNERFEPRLLTVIHPRKTEVSFVMARATEPHVIHIYIGKGSHQTMTASVAAGSRTGTSLASGVAPNARLLFVRRTSPEGGLAFAIEGFIDASRRQDVDVISASTPIAMVPDTGADFVGLFFSRLHAVYRKPIVNGAGNYGLMLGQVHANGSILSTGGTLGPATYGALHGGRPLPRLIVHPASAAGPALDGAVKPDFLAPMERIAADLPWNTGLDVTPHNDPARDVPAGYQISCCTSASSPYSAGVIALLISAARQSNVPYSVESLSRALRVSARPLPGFQAHQQGNGALDIDAAWRELSRPIEPPAIVATAAIVHPLAQYAARGAEGQGILEFEGWTAGATGTRDITLRRESGPAHPVTYRLTWTADDGTFTSPSSVTLPLRVPVRVPVGVTVRATGAHSGLLSLHDPDTSAVVSRTQATIVAPDRIDPATNTLRLSGRLDLMQQQAHYLHIPPGTDAVSFELEVTRGVVQPTILQSHGLLSSYYMHAHPMSIFFAGKGRYNVVLPNPEPGTWTFLVDNESAKYPAALALGPRDDGDAEYTMTMRVLGSSIRPTQTRRGLAVDIRNDGAHVEDPLLEAWPGSLKSHRARFLPSGLPNVVNIDVPPNAGALSLDLRTEKAGASVELHLYDCTTGDCFSYDIGFPAASSQTLLVRNPAPGRWVAAVNAAPFPNTMGSFVVDEIVTSSTPVRQPLGAHATGAGWRTVIEAPPSAPAIGDRTPVVFLQVVDLALERREADQPWLPHPKFVRLRDRPVAIGTAVYKR